MQYTDIRFPHLGIVLSHVGRYSRHGGCTAGGKANWAESRDLYGLTAVDDDSGDYWCKNLLRCIFMGCI